MAKPATFNGGPLKVKVGLTLNNVNNVIKRGNVTVFRIHGYLHMVRNLYSFKIFGTPSGMFR